MRFRPILMTSLAFIFGVVPLVWAVGAGAELRQTLGTTVFSGMIGVTAFGLIFTPVFYVLARRMAGRRTRQRYGRGNSASGRVAVDGIAEPACVTGSVPSSDYAIMIPGEVSMATMAITAPDQIIRWHYLYYVAIALAVMIAAIASGDRWYLNFVHVMSGVLWTGIDLFMGFIVGPVLRMAPMSARREIIIRLVPRTLFLMPTLSAITGTTGWYLAKYLGYFDLPWPQFGWVAAALTLLGLMTIQGTGILLPTNLWVCFQLPESAARPRKDRPGDAGVLLHGRVSGADAGRDHRHYGAVCDGDLKSTPRYMRTRSAPHADGRCRSSRRVRRAAAVSGASPRYACAELHRIADVEFRRGIEFRMAALRRVGAMTAQPRYATLRCSRARFEMRRVRAVDHVVDWRDFGFRIDLLDGILERSGRSAACRRFPA